ncbi:hypothetical protein [Pararhodobacter zhoushanensis]|uniref:hypothetical protein n=1 Tax=Pararhodobacter zhoushanensis TaxID=2479545 RepID=UPI000F8C8E87|nr:hypothetical protein [Pararhodobacter zhoushanensis]
MATFRRQTLAPETAVFSKTDYPSLQDHAMGCLLSRSDRRALAGHIQRADRIGTGVDILVARLLSQKLLYASFVDDARIAADVAISGSRLRYAIADQAAQTAQLCHDEAMGPEDLCVASPLGATLIGMKAGNTAPLFAPDGTFCRLRLISLEGRAA